MNLGSWTIDDLLTFTAQTQVFSTGVATDADAVPAYRVYEDETTTPLLTGTMALLDGSNTAGFYSEQITLSAANGFEKGKSYSIYISATVSSVAGATQRCFQIQAAVDAKSAGGTAWGSGAITAASIAADAITDAKVASDVTIASVTGAVASVTAGVTVTTNNDKTGYTVSTVSDKTGYSLSAGGVQAIWDALTSALTTAGSIGKRLVDFVTTLVYTAPPAAAPTAAAVRAEMDSNSTQLAKIGTPVSSVSADIAAIKAILPAALVGGRMDSSVGAMAADTVTSSALAASAGTEIAAAILAASVETGVSVQQMLEAIGAAVAGNYDHTTGTFKAVGNSGTTRITTVLAGTDRTNTPSL